MPKELKSRTLQHSPCMSGVGVAGLCWVLMDDPSGCAAQVDLEVATVDDEGLRGVRAARDMVTGQVAVKIPKALGVVLGEWNLTSEVRILLLLGMRIHCMSLHTRSESACPCLIMCPHAAVAVDVSRFPSSARSVAALPPSIRQKPR